MKVVMVSKALIVGAYQRKAAEIAQLGIDLTVLTPPYWQDGRGRQELERTSMGGGGPSHYELRPIPLRFNGNYHLHYYPTLAAELRQLQPDIVHMDEEPYNLATWLGLQAARKIGCAGTFFTWQNLYRRYPLPFRWFEKSLYQQTPIALAGNKAAADVMHRKGYRGRVVVCPQFGVDPELFRPNDRFCLSPAIQPNPTVSQLHNSRPQGKLPDTTAPAAMNLINLPKPLRIGYAGGLLQEKGLDLLLRACANLQGNWRLDLVGSGHDQERLAALASELEIAQNVSFLGRRKSEEMVEFYRTVDLFVLPSRTTSSWKEQFGRVLVEAMACEVAVIGSDSGEIPNVIGRSECIFPEDNQAALASLLQKLHDSPEERLCLGRLGRQRVLERYTMKQIAEQTMQVYEQLLKY